jgi:hypothetical protein
VNTRYGCGFAGVVVASLALLAGCAGADSPGAEASGGDDGTGDEGGSTGSQRGGAGGRGSGGQTPGGSGGELTGAGGRSEPAQGGAGTGVGGMAERADASPPDEGTPDPGTGGSAPAATGQGPVAEGKIAFSQDFEQNMDGMSRSPNSLPEDRIQIIDDPVKERGKIVRIMFKEGDNFRTSAGTQPRSWFSAAKGYTVKPGTTVSVAWGFMWENVAMNAHFAQLIRDGGPTWMWDVDGAGNLSMTSHRGTGATGNLMKLEPMKWYDFMVTTHYVNGGETNFYVNGKKVLTGKSPGGPDGRFDFGIYTRAGAHPARNVFISNVSIGEL